MTTGALARAGLTVTLAFLASRVLGWVRVVVLGNQFGAGPELDAYYAAFRIPDLIFQLVAAGAIASALVPILSGLLAADERSRAWRVASSVGNLVVLVLLVVAGVMFLAAPLIVPPLVPGFDAPTTALTVDLTRLMLVSPIMLAAGAVASSVLNTDGRFGAAAMAPVMYNVCIILGAVLLGPSMGVTGAAIGVVAGAAAHVLVQVPALRGRFTYHRAMDLRDRAARQAFLLMAPRAIGLGASQITFMVNTTLATSVGVGAVVAYNVAFNVLQIPLGVIGLPIGIVLLPTMSRALAVGDAPGYGRLITASLRLLLWITLLVSAVGIVTRQETVVVLFGGGFDRAALEQTAATLGVFLLGLPAHSMNVILARAFYSDRDTATPVLVAVSSVVVNIAVSLATVGTLGLTGLALGIAAGGWFESLALAGILRHRRAEVAMAPVLRGGAASLLGAILAGAVAALVLAVLGGSPALQAGRLADLVRIVAAALAAGVVYLLYSRVVRLAELPRSLELLRSALRRG